MVSSAAKEVIIGDDHPIVLIGERINPAGKKKLAESLVKYSGGLIKDKNQASYIILGIIAIIIIISIFLFHNTFSSLSPEEFKELQNKEGIIP